MTETTETTFATDAILLSEMDETTRVEFLKWIAELEGLLPEFSNPYDAPLPVNTGLECWHTFFVNGYSPREALVEDCSYAD